MGVYKLYPHNFLTYQPLPPPPPPPPPENPPPPLPDNDPGGEDAEDMALAKELPKLSENREVLNRSQEPP